MWRLLRLTYEGWIRDGGPRLAAAIAYHALFALAPLAIVAVGIAGLVYGERAASGELAHLLEGVLGGDAASLTESLLAGAGGGTTVTIAGVVLLAWGSARAFLQLQSALNTMWRVRITPGTKWWRVLPYRLLPFGMTAAASVLLVAAVFLGDVAGILVDWGVLAEGAAQSTFESVLLAAGAYMAFAMVLKVLPDTRISWRDVWVGAGVTLVLVGTVTMLFRFYLTETSITSVFGAAGTFVAVMLWVYYASQAFLLGAEFVEVQAQERGAPIQPAPYAELVKRVAEEL